MTGRRPWLKWYPADWRADEKLRMCGFAARGLWADMLGLMHVAEPYGYLLINGAAPSPAQLANLLGGSEREIKRLLDELGAAGVYSFDDAGIIYSRRMLRDKAREDRDRENGKGGGNPSLKGGSAPPVKADGNPGVNPPDKAHMPDARKPDSSSLRSDAAPASPSKPSAEIDLIGEMPANLRRSKPKDEVWGALFDALEPMGLTRDVVGMLIRDHGESAVHAAMTEAARSPPAEPKSWLVKRLKGQAHGARNKHPSGFGNPFLAALADGAGPDRGA